MRTAETIQLEMMMMQHTPRTDTMKINMLSASVRTHMTLLILPSTKDSEGSDKAKEKERK
jgi:hypothetical protein